MVWMLEGTGKFGDEYKINKTNTSYLHFLPGQPHIALNELPFCVGCLSGNKFNLYHNHNHTTLRINKFNIDHNHNHTNITYK